MYAVRLDLYEALELRIPATRTLEKVMVKLRWGNNKVSPSVSLVLFSLFLLCLLFFPSPFPSFFSLLLFPPSFLFSALGILTNFVDRLSISPII